jgi:hypothetical protein
MTYSKFSSLVLVGAMMGMAAPVYSQQPADAAKAPTPSTSATASSPDSATAAQPVAAAAAPAADKPAGPSAETLKKARQSGLKPEVRGGVTVFCWEDADIGSSFKTKKCVGEARLADILERRQLQREEMQRGGSCTGGCGGSSK